MNTNQSTIHVQPAPPMRRRFAQWAVAQRPKVRTISTHEFAVPPRLYVDMPEELLRGSTVDGHPYVSPEEPTAPTVATAATKNAQPPGPDSGAGGARAAAAHEEEPSTAPVEPAVDGTTGSSVPVPERAPGPEHHPTTALASDDPAFSLPGPSGEQEPAEESPGDADSAAFECAECDRPFTSARGREMHRRRVHVSREA